MTTLILFHADPSVRDRYAAAIPGANIVLVNSHGSQFSAGYDERSGIAARFPTLARLIEAFAPAFRAGEPLVLVGFSAGCWSLRAYLREAAARDIVAAAIFLDGLHASGSDQRADPAPLDGVFAFADLCMAEPSRHMLIVSHTQIIPPGYASTGAVADLVCAHLGTTRMTRSEGLDFGAVKVVSYGGGDAAAHSRQLLSAGPDLLRQHVAPHLAQTSSATADSGVVEGGGQSLGARAVAWSLEEMRRGVSEHPGGSNTGPRIREYFAPCRRRGTEARLGLRSGNWCAAAACAAMAASARPDEELPHGYRAAAIELVADLRDRGLWRPAEAARSGQYVPCPGDLAVWDRSTPGKPETSWFRHVARVLAWGGDGAFDTIGGNEGDRWKVSSHRVDEPRLLGFGAYPRADVAPEHHVSPELATLDDDLAALGDGAGEGAPDSGDA